jgi:hypothetical protein
MKKKANLIWILAALILLSSNLALAIVTCNPISGNSAVQGCYEIKEKIYNTTIPIINISFLETIYVRDDHVLYKLGELDDNMLKGANRTYFVEHLYDPVFLENLKSKSSFPIERLNVPIRPYSYQPTVHLPNGIYLFKVSAYNALRVDQNISVVFLINGTSMKFWVSSPVNDLVSADDKPMYAFSNESEFDIDITAERDVESCRFTTSQLDTKTTIASYYETAAYRFENVSPRTVRYYDFNISEHFPATVTSAPLSVICKEPSGRYSYNQIMVGVDKTPPVIDISTDYSPVVDYDQRRTNMTIKTDDLSACIIKKVYVPNYDTQSKITEMNNMPFIIRNESFDFTAYNEFVKNYAELLIYNSLPTPHNYTYNITCTNLANLKSSKLYVVNVALINVQNFEFYSPSSGYINTKTILVNGSVSRGGTGVTCNATLNTSDRMTQMTRGGIYNGLVTFHTSLTVPRDGTYTVYVTCTYMYGAYNSRTVTIDSTPPTVPNVTGGETTCSLENLEITALSKDNVSGIYRYYYNITVSEAQKEYLTGRSSSGSFTINIDDLEEGKSYVMRVWAEDNAGNIGGVASKTIKVTNSSAIICDKTPPTIKINSSQNNSTKAWSVVVGCNDSHSGCKKTFYYAVEPNSSKKCNATRSADLGFVVQVTTSATFCAIVFDNNNNNATGSIILTAAYPSTCNNTIKDANETDLNCGGPCPPCALNKTCTGNLDCSSKYCLNGKCATPTCTDKVKNGNEAGIDCGGTCLTKCAINSTCTEDDDCLSRNCDASGKCQSASCTNKKVDGNETDIDCGGSCPEPCDKGKSCVIGEDCATNYCDPKTRKCATDPELDSDGDGLPDVWEEKHCGSATGCNPKDDLDNDGFTNKEEYDAGTDPNDADDHPDGRKIKPISMIFLILGGLCILSGGGFKVYNMMEDEKHKKLSADKEMFGTLSQIPKMSSIGPAAPAQRELTEEEKIKGQQARLKALKERSLDRKKMINEFDTDADKPKAEEESAKPVENTTADVANKSEPAQKPIEPKKKLLDDGIKDEYVDIGALNEKKKQEDPFNKLKTIAKLDSKEEIKETKPQESKASAKSASKLQAEENLLSKSDEKMLGIQSTKKDAHKTDVDAKADEKVDAEKKRKSASNEDVFEKLKTLSAQKKTK